MAATNSGGQECRGRKGQERCERDDARDDGDNTREDGNDEDDGRRRTIFLSLSANQLTTIMEKFPYTSEKKELQIRSIQSLFNGNSLHSSELSV
jgi:hypothetical protein